MAKTKVFPAVIARRITVLKKKEFQECFSCLSASFSDYSHGDNPIEIYEFSHHLIYILISLYISP
jgi:hypothetical protein